MKHTIFSYHGILSLNDGNHVHELMAEPEQETIESFHEDNEPQRYSSDEFFSSDDSDDEVDYANDARNLNCTSDEDS